MVCSHTRDVGRALELFAVMQERELSPNMLPREAWAPWWPAPKAALFCTQPTACSSVFVLDTAAPQDTRLGTGGGSPHLNQSVPTLLRADFPLQGRSLMEGGGWSGHLFF